MKPEESKNKLSAAMFLIVNAWCEFYRKFKYLLKGEEEKVHGEIVNYMRVNYPDELFLHYPSGGYRHQLKNKAGKTFSLEAIKLKLMGTLAGVPDLFAPRPIPPHAGFWCEVKKPGESLRKSQKEMHQKLTELGYYVCVVRSLEEFQREWELYLNEGQPDMIDAMRRAISGVYVKTVQIKEPFKPSSLDTCPNCGAIGIHGCTGRKDTRLYNGGKA